MNRISQAMLLAGAASTATLWSCTSDLVSPQQEQYEEVTKAFVEEFGINALGHPMSEASGVTLKVKTSTPTRMRVMYDDGDNYCLAGQLTVPAGETELPFIVPSSVSELLIETVSGTYAAAVGSTFDLDKAREAEVASRAGYPGGEGRVEMRFKTNRLLKIWNDAVPIYENPSQPSNLFIDPTKVTAGTVSFDHTDVAAYAPDGTRVDDHLRTYVVFRGLRRGKNCGKVTYNGVDYNGVNAVSNYGFCNTGTDGQEWYTLIENVNNSELYSYDQEDTEYSKGKYNTGFGHPGYHLFPMNFNVGAADESTLYPNGWTDSHLYWNTPMQFLDRFNVGYVMYKPNENVPYEIYKDGSWVECSQTGVFTGFTFPPDPYNETIDGKEHYMGDGTSNVDFNNIVFLTVSIDPADRVEMVGSKELRQPKKVVGNSFLIAAEDLGGSYDWDFNDAVFAVDCVTYSVTDLLLQKCGLEKDENKDYPDVDDAYFYNISVKPLAAGGTLPLYIAYHGTVYTSDYMAYANKLGESYGQYTDFNNLAWAIFRYNLYSGAPEDGIWILGNEIHRWFGSEDTGEMINTGAKADRTATEVRFFAAADPRDIGSVKSETNSPLHNFSIIVDKDEAISLDTEFPSANPRGAFTKFDGNLGENGYAIGSVTIDNKSAAPMMLYVSKDWLWPTERTPVMDAYDGFAPWLRGETSEWVGSDKPTDMTKVTAR